jgi:hypothetical protein
VSDYIKLIMEESPRYYGAPAIAPYRKSSVAHYFPVTSANLRPGPSLMDRSDEVRGHLSPTSQLVDTYAPSGAVNLRGYGPYDVVLLHLAGFTMTVQAGDGTNEVQTLTITGSPTGGTFTITTPIALGSETTIPIPYNATPAQVQKALQRLPGIGRDGVVCAGTQLPAGSVTITFQGRHAATNVGALTTTDSFTGGTGPASAIVESTPGATGSVLTPAGTGVATGAYLWTSAKRTGNQAKTAEVTAGYEGNSVWKRQQGVGISQLSIDAMAAMQATLLGLTHEEVGADPGDVPSYLTNAVAPFLSRDLLVSWQSGSGNISDFSMQVSNPIVAVRDYGKRSAFPGTMRYDQGYVTATGSVSTDALDPDDEDALLTAGTFAASAHWRSESKVASSGHPYEMFVQMPACQIVGGQGAEDLTARRNHGGSYEFMAAYDEAAGYDVRFSVVCALSAIETYA